VVWLDLDGAINHKSIMTTQEEKDRSSSTLARGGNLKKKANANETGTYASSA